MKSLKEILIPCEGLEIYEKRYDSDEYCELVFFLKDQSAWVEKISETLGSPHKPLGVNPSSIQQQLTEQYGGIRKDQTLFFKEFKNGKVIAMFWPWQDKSHVTLRMVFEPASE